MGTRVKVKEIILFRRFSLSSYKEEVYLKTDLLSISIHMPWRTRSTRYASLLGLPWIAFQSPTGSSWNGKLHFFEAAGHSIADISRYGSLSTRRVDLVGDYAGQELFLVEGDSLLLRSFSDPKLDFDRQCFPYIYSMTM